MHVGDEGIQEDLNGAGDLTLQSKEASVSTQVNSLERIEPSTTVVPSLCTNVNVQGGGLASSSITPDGTEPCIVVEALQDADAADDDSTSVSIATYGVAAIDGVASSSIAPDGTQALHCS